MARLGTRFSVWSRNRKARLMQQLVEDAGISTVLLIGSEDASFPWSNIVERALIDCAEFTVASGLGPRIELSTARMICDGRALPFKDNAFDLVFSNAVVEHVGGIEDQKEFVSEHLRVGVWAVVTTPNRWFPVESHTRAVLKHWSPAWRARQPSFTRLLSRQEFRNLFAGDVHIRGRWWSATFVALSYSGAPSATARRHCPPTGRAGNISCS